MTYEEALQYTLAGEAVFILGSGFSIGAQNRMLDESEKKLLVGSQLARKLAELTELDVEAPLDIVSQEYIDRFGEKALVDFLRNHYVVGEYAEYYKAIARIKKVKVYTTNYDDLVERVCNDCGNKVKGYNIDSDIRRVNKEKMVLHLNGYIRDLEDSVLPDSFKLSHLSYNSTHFFDTPWYSYLIDELYSAKVIFIVGLSFFSDLDIRRIVGNSQLSNKIFIIESANLSDTNRKFLEKYGRVLLCGIERFCEDLAGIKCDDFSKEPAIFYKSFKKLNCFESVVRPQDRDIYNLFFKGLEKDDIYKRNEQRKYEALVNRNKIDEVVQGIQEGKSFIIYSDLGNGKSIFVNEVINLCPEIDFYCIKQVNNTKKLNEIKSLCTDNTEKVIICDPANLFLEVIKKFSSFDLKNIRFILVLRSSMYDNYYSAIYDVIETMQGVHFTNSINLDVLEDNELEELDALISTYGFYGDIAGYSSQKRIQYLKNECKAKFQNILLYLFESMHIIEKFIDSIEKMNSNFELRRILILAFVSEILELGLNLNDYKILLGINDVERVVKREQNCGDFLDISRGEILIKSSIVAKELMMKTDVFSKDEVFQVLILVMKQLDKLYLGSERYKNAMKNLVSCSYISYVFGYQMDSSKLIEYYESAKELNFCKKNLFFWEQYAIVCVNIKQFDRAERYFKTAYSLAKQRGQTFSAYQIDNHYARYLLENQLYYRKSEGSLSVFVEAHRLLNKNSEVERLRKNSRYYKFRVARAYRDYYDTFVSNYSAEDKNIFLQRCKEMYFSLLSYKRGLREDEIRKDVKECESALRYILECEKGEIKH